MDGLSRADRTAFLSSAVGRLRDDSDVETRPTVDARRIDGVDFVTNLVALIARPIRAMAERLKGVGRPLAVRLHIRRRREG